MLVYVCAHILLFFYLLVWYQSTNTGAILNTIIKHIINSNEKLEKTTTKGHLFAFATNRAFKSLTNCKKNIAFKILQHCVKYLIL